MCRELRFTSTALAPDFCNSLLQPNSPFPHHHCNQYFNHCLHSYVDLPMLHEISYFHMKLPVSRVGARRRLRINSVGLETSHFFNIYIFFFFHMMCSTGAAFALRWRQAPLWTPLRCLYSREMNHVWSLTHIEDVLDGHVTWWLGSVRCHRCLVVCHELEGGLNSLWSCFFDLPSWTQGDSSHVVSSSPTELRTSPMFTSAREWKQAALEQMWKKNTFHRPL